jgi:hypothetical protein|nr:MAG TPA: type I neck protein [Caudoviricetes sp.]
MANSVKFGKFKMSRAGYAALMDSPGVQGVIGRKAQAVKTAADAGLSGGGYALPVHEVKDFQGKLARGKVVRTKTDQARYSEAKRKTLSKSLGAANG